MRPIDRFVGALFRQSGDELLLETGKPGRVRVGNEEKILLAQDVRTDQIELLLRDVIPSDVQRTFRHDGEVAFPYRSPSGPVVVRAKRTGDKLAVTVRPYAIPGQRVVERMSPPPPPSGFGSNFGHIRSQPIAAIELAPVQAISPPTSSFSPPPFSASTEPSQNRKFPIRSADSGPIELDLSTGSLPHVSESEMLELSSKDIVVDRSPSGAPVGALASSSSEGSKSSRTSSAMTKVRNKIDPILIALIEQKGSDLHLTAGLQPRIRKDGDIGLLPGHTEVLESHTIEAWLMEIAPEKSRAKFKESNDADYAYELPGLARIRVNAFRDRRGVGGVFRVIPATVLTAEQLRLPKAVLELCTLPKGLVVVTGPTGSGKSTTLAGMIDYINKTRAEHVITIEDPVEFVHLPQKCLVNQREVHTDTESFSSGLRAALREDPDIILVGEMRDLETISVAVETAETGHLVFGTLHTTTAVSTVDRIIDSFPTDRQAQIRVMLASALKGVIAQTLLKKKGGGRVAALEVLLSVPAVANLVREGKTFQIPSIMQTGKAQGMQTLNDALHNLVHEGLVEAEEALSSSMARNELKALLDKSERATPMSRSA